ncbi:MAG: FAD-linked oxidase C-terminal domain-containing protein [Caldilineaceae bacterium]
MTIAYGELTQLFDAGQVLTNPVELITYEIDAGFDRGKPDGVFFPNATEDVSRLMRWAWTNGARVIARGAGTGLAGGAVPEHGGLVVVTSRLNRILSIEDAARLAHVQSGVTNLAVDSAVKRHGLYFPPDPSSGRSSVIGGNIGTNAGGPHCFKYGVTTNYVQGVRMVLADGTVVRLGGPAVDYPEYDLLAAVVGGEGTLGLVTEAWLRLIADPPAVKTMMVSFDSEAHAGEAVSAVIAAGLVPATLELMDQRSMRMIEEFTGAGLPVDAGAALIVEVDGYPAGIDTQIEEVADTLQAHGGFGFRVAQSEEERAQIWYGRKSAAGAFSRLSPSYYLTDVTVRRSLLGLVLQEILAVCDKYDVRTANFFHAGDGNLHPLILCDESDAELMERVHKAGKEIIQICLDNDGSITGEHGVGMEKRGYMTAMYSGAELAAMVAVKDVFDPNNLCNPGKVLPPDLPPADRVPPAATVADTVAPTSPRRPRLSCRVHPRRTHRPHRPRT